MKNRVCIIQFIILMLIFFRTVSAQTDITNKEISITNICDIFINGSYINAQGGSIANGGIIYISNNIINNSDNKIFTTNAGKVVFNGSYQQTISGVFAIIFFKLEINKSSGNILLNQDIEARDSLYLKSGSIDLNSREINLGTSGVLVGETNENRVFGNSGLIKSKSNLNSPTLSKNISGLGLYISSPENFGYVFIERGHAGQISNGDTSISRYYNFIPEDPFTHGMIDIFKISYLDGEIVHGETQYKIFLSADDGAEWRNKGGFADTANNFISTTTISPPAIGKTKFSSFPIESFATCLPIEPDYISAVFLASSQVLDGDPVKFVQLSYPNPQAYAWNFGDGMTSEEASPTHNYILHIDSIADQYQITMSVTNGICSDTRKKNILVNPSPPGNLRNSGLYSGIEFVNLYPNPNLGNFTMEIKTDEEKDIEIYIMNMQGRLLEKKSVRTSVYKEELNFTYLNPGLYFIKLQVGEECRVLKMVKL